MAKSRKSSVRKTSRKSSRKTSRKSSRKSSRKGSRKSSRKSSRKRSHKGSHKRRTVKDVLNRQILLSETPASIKRKLSVTLKKNKFAGTGLFATKPIRKGRTIAYYKMKVNEDSKKKSYKSPTKCMYCFTMYTKSGNAATSTVGDVHPESVPQPGKDNIPYWAHFSNEPSPGNPENSEIDISTKMNFKNRKKLKVGDFVTFKLKATRNIKKGEEIVWCYGEGYGRKYKTGCGYSAD